MKTPSAPGFIVVGFFRATRSYADLATKADFLKVVVYNNCGGERYANFIRNIGSTLFRDVPREELLRFNNHLLNYGDEPKLDELAAAGLSPAERRDLVALLNSLPAHMSYVLIEHDLDIALKVTERVTVMHNGRVLKTGTPSEIENDAQVQAIYMGGKH